MTSRRLIGGWQLDPDMGTKEATSQVWEALAEMCSEHGVMPIGNKRFALFNSRAEAIQASWQLEVPAPSVLHLGEMYGFGPERVFLAAAVDVRDAHEAAA